MIHIYCSQMVTVDIDDGYFFRQTYFRGQQQQLTQALPKQYLIR